jgi:hypothetical protein
MPKHCPPNDDAAMRGCRARNEVSGQLRQKRGDTLAATIEQQYGVNLGVRGDMHLSTLRELSGESSVQGVIEQLGRKERGH